MHLTQIAKNLAQHLVPRSWFIERLWPAFLTLIYELKPKRGRSVGSRCRKSELELGFSFVHLDCDLYNSYREYEY
jgi:hypothetical protein